MLQTVRLTALHQIFPSGLSRASFVQTKTKRSFHSSADSGHWQEDTCACLTVPDLAPEKSVHNSEMSLHANWP